MKKIMSIVLGLSLAFGLVALAAEEKAGEKGKMEDGKGKGKGKGKKGGDKAPETK